MRAYWGGAHRGVCVRVLTGGDELFWVARSSSFGLLICEMREGAYVRVCVCAAREREHTCMRAGVLHMAACVCL